MRPAVSTLNILYADRRTHVLVQLAVWVREKRSYSSRLRVVLVGAVRKSSVLRLDPPAERIEGYRLGLPQGEEADPRWLSM